MPEHGLVLFRAPDRAKYPSDLRRKKFSYDEFSRLWIIKGSEGSRNYGITVRKR